MTSITVLPRRRPASRARICATGLGALAAAALLIAAPGATADTPKTDAKPKKVGSGIFNPEVATLPNGMKIIVLTHRRAPVVTHMVWYRVGSADEPRGQSGIAHFLEHLMFKSTKSLSNGEFSRIVAANGGQENAFTSYDYTGYHQKVAKDRLPIVMRLEADRMTNLVLTEKDIVSERKVIIEERNSRTDTRPSSLLWEQMMASLYQHYPYRIPIIGWRYEMERLSRKNALDFYKLHYAPNNAILIVSGDVSMADVLPLAKKYYGPIKRANLPPRTRVHEPPQRVARRVTMTDARVREPSWTRLYYAPSFSYGAKKHAYALSVLSEILGEGETSRLYQNLVVKQKVATRFGTSYAGTRLGPGYFYIGATPARGVSIAKLEAAIDAELALVAKNGVTDAELARVKRRMKAELAYARENTRTGAYVFGTALTTGRTVADIEAWPDRVNALTVADIKAAAQYVLMARKSVTGLLLPAKKTSN